MHILERCFRVYTNIDHLDEAIGFYEGLQGVTCARRVKIVETGIDAVKVGGFLILAGTDEQIAKVRQIDTIFYLDDLDEFATWLGTTAAEVIHPPRTVTGGRNLTVRHPDGLVVEYFQATPAPEAER